MATPMQVTPMGAAVSIAVAKVYSSTMRMSPLEVSIRNAISSPEVDPTVMEQHQSAYGGLCTISVCSVMNLSSCGEPVAWA